MTDTFTFALEATIPTVQYGNVRVRANNPAELLERVRGIASSGLVDELKVLEAEGNLAAGGVKAEPVDSGAWGNSGDGNSGAEPTYADNQRPAQQSYAREKPQASGNGQYPDRAYLNIPFSAAADRQRAKGMGARFDGDKKQWYSTPKFSGENHEALVNEFGV